MVASVNTPWEILKDKNAGFYIENSISEISKVIDEIINLDKYQYLKIRQNAINMVDENFKSEKLIEEWNKVYSS